MDNKVRYIICGIALVGLILLAVRLFNPSDPLEELKRTESVAESPETREAVAVMEQAVQALNAQDKKAFRLLMLDRDGTNFQNMTRELWEPSFGAATVLGYSKMVHTHKPEDLSVYVRSENRKQYYQFCMSKDDQGKYKILSVSAVKRLPESVGKH